MIGVHNDDEYLDDRIDYPIHTNVHLDDLPSLQQHDHARHDDAAN